MCRRPGVHPGTAPGPRAVPARSTSKLSARRSFYSPLNECYSEMGGSGEMHPTFRGSALPSRQGTFFSLSFAGSDSHRMNAEQLAKAKSLGFSDRQIAHLTGGTEDEIRA